MVFSSAYRKIMESEIQVQGQKSTMWYLTDAKGKRVAAGLYYLVFMPEGQKRKVLSVVVLP
jgi:hypothetical protein